jgi:serine phosphatase RsbU (regulator of sigma subunit)
MMMFWLRPRSLSATFPTVSLFGKYFLAVGTETVISQQCPITSIQSLNLLLSQSPMPSSPFLERLALRLRPDMGQMSDIDRAGNMINMRILFLSSPLVLVGIVWLVAITDITVIGQKWVGLLGFFLLERLFARFPFEMRLEMRPGQYTVGRGSLDTMIHWMAILLFGPIVIWFTVITDSVSLLLMLRRETNPSVRWGTAAMQILNLGPGLLVAIFVLWCYERIGGVYPFPGFQWQPMLRVMLVMGLEFLLQLLFSFPFMLSLVQDRKFWESGGIRIGGLDFFRFIVLVSGMSAIANPFAMLGAGLYVEKGVPIFLFFCLGAFLANVLASRLSQSVRQSQQRSRELATLERLGRAIINAPADGSTLPDVLRQYVPEMLTNVWLVIWLNSDETLYRSPAQPIAAARETQAQQWLQKSGEPYALTTTIHLPDHPRLTFQELIVPVESDNGQRLGGVHLLARSDSEPIIHLLPALQSLAAQIASALHRAEVYTQQIASEKMTRELEVAGRIQASFLPRSMPQIEGWEIAAAIIPARQTSGDFYDFVMLDRGRVAFIVADVADKGTGAALYMALSRTLLRTYASQYPDDPARVLQASNDRLFTDTESDQFVTVFYAVLDPATNTLTYANAGHNPALILNNSTTQELGQTGIPLGMFEAMAWKTKSVTLTPGDLLVMYSDGVSEAQDGQNAEFGMERLIAAAHTDQPALEGIQKHIITTINQFVGDAPQFDDITLVLVRPRYGE